MLRNDDNTKLWTAPRWSLGTEISIRIHCTKTFPNMELYSKPQVILLNHVKIEIRNSSFIALGNSIAGPGFSSQSTSLATGGLDENVLSPGCLSIWFGRFRRKKRVTGNRLWGFEAMRHSQFAKNLSAFVCDSRFELSAFNSNCCSYLLPASDPLEPQQIILSL